MRSTVVMAVGAGRFPVELAVNMAVRAIHLSMYFIQDQTGNTMFEDPGSPIAVTGNAIPVKLSNLASRGMAGPAFQILVIPTQWPTDSSMIETLGFLFCMTIATPVHVVAGSAGLMMLLQTLGKRGFPLYVMTTTATFLLMAIDALKTKKMYVLLVVEGDHRTAIVTGLVYPFVRLLNVRMQQAHNVCCICDFNQLHLSRFSCVTYSALGIMTPFPVTAHTLTVVSTLETGLI